MSIVYVNIGSNLGNSRMLIETAIDRIGTTFGIYCKSGYVESEPWGYDSANRFLNVAISFRSEEEPEQILTKLQEIEKSISGRSHRDASGGYADREIDIDIMAIDEIVYETDFLQVPHRHLLERDFFMIPFKEIAPWWKYPEKIVNS